MSSGSGTLARWRALASASSPAMVFGRDFLCLAISWTACAWSAALVSSRQNAAEARCRCSKDIRFHNRPAVGVMSLIADILCATRYLVLEGTMITVEHRQPVRGRSAWRPADFPTPETYSFTLTDAHFAAFDRALAANRAADRSAEDITTAEFALEDIAADVVAWRDEVLRGRGFIVLRELPRERYTHDDLGMLFFGLGTHFGRAV